MSTRSVTLRAPLPAAPVLAWLSVVALGCGAFLGYVGVMSANVELALAGALLAGGGLLVIVCAGWLDPMMLLIWSLPLPALYSTDTARVAPALLVSVVVTIAWLFGRGLDPRPLPWRVLPWRATLALLGAIVFAAVLAQQPMAAARELINWGVLLALLFVIITVLADAPDRVRKIALTIALLASVCGALAFLETLGFIPARFARPTSSLNRAALGFGWPNELGMFMALCLPFSVYACSLAATPRQRAFTRIGLAATIVGLVATFSRGSWLAVLMASLVLLFAGERRFVLRVWLCALLAALVLDVMSGGAIRDRIASTIGDWVVEQRAALTLAGVLMFRAHPFTGVGPGGFADSLQEFGPGITWLWDYLPTAQNAYVQMAAEAGIVGLLGLLVFLGATLRVLLRATRARRNAGSDVRLHRTLLWSFSVACMLGFVEWTFAHGIGQLIMLVSALALALESDTRSARASATVALP